MLFRMALRNLWRRPIQSALAGGAIAAGLLFTVIMVNIQEGAWDQMLDESVRATAGYVVVQPRDYQETKDPDLLLDDSAALADKVRQAVPGQTVLRRTFLSGLLASPDNSVAISLNGVEPDAEKQFSNLPGKLVSGAWFDQTDQKGILVGSELARRLAVQVGDKVVLTVSSQGELQARPLRIAAIFETGGKQMDAFFAVVPLTVAQQLLPGHADPATQVAVMWTALDVPRALVQKVADAVGGAFDVLPWQGAMPEAEAAAKMDRIGGRMMYGILAIIVSVGIANVLLMSLFQRTRELGVMMAVGMRPAQIARLILAEGFLLGLIGAVIGYAAGELFSWPIVVYGVDVAAMTEAAPVSNVALDTTIKAGFMWGMGLLWAMYFVFLSVLASLWPALRAARLQPTEALRHA